MNKPESAPRNPAEKTKCKHYWIIESPDGPTSRGVCKYCGVEEEFKNYALYSKREDDITTVNHGSEKQ